MKFSFSFICLLMGLLLSTSVFGGVTLTGDDKKAQDERAAKMFADNRANNALHGIESPIIKSNSGLTNDPIINLAPSANTSAGDSGYIKHEVNVDGKTVTEYIDRTTGIISLEKPSSNSFVDAPKENSSESTSGATSKSLTVTPPAEKPASTSTGTELEPSEPIDDRFAINKGADKIISFMDGKEGLDRNIARPLANEVLKQMGAPGFYISKYLSYRKILTQPICTLSEKMSLAANVLTLTGDLTNHILTWQDTKKLKEEFKGDKKILEDKAKDFDVEKELNSGEKLSVKDQEIQLKTIEFLIKSEEQELRRLDTLIKFKYPALALQLASKIMNAAEALAEIGSMGTVVAKTNVCKTTLATIFKAADVAVTVAADAAVVTAAADAVAEESGKGPPLVLITSGTGLLTSAGYAEEMIVGVVGKMLKKDGPTSKGDKLKNRGVKLAVRYAVRAIIRANILAVDGFMRSAVGRAVVYAYNIWVTYSEFDHFNKHIEYTKVKLAKLKQIKTRFTSVTFHKIKDNFVERSAEVSRFVMGMLMDKAYAVAAPEKMVYDISMCISKNACNKKFTLDDNYIREYLKVMPEQFRNEQLAVVKNSYAIGSFVKLANQQISIYEVDQNKIRSEIKRKVVTVEKLAVELDKKKIVTFNALRNYELKRSNEEFNAFSPLMEPGYNKESYLASYSPATINETKMDSLTNAVKNLQDTKKPLIAAQAHDPSIPVELQNLPSKEVDNSAFEYSSGIHSKDANIWEIINYRYLKNYHNLKLE